MRVLGLRSRRLVRELSGLAKHDQLTGQLNRHGFQRQIDHEWERAGRTHSPLSLVIGDLDTFKNVNDRLGHMGGDMALERVGGILTRSKRKVDYAARLGGDEFALVLPGTDANCAYGVAERVRAEIEESFAKRPVQRQGARPKLLRDLQRRGRACPRGRRRGDRRRGLSARSRPSPSTRA